MRYKNQKNKIGDVFMKGAKFYSVLVISMFMSFASLANASTKKVLVVFSGVDYVSLKQGGDKKVHPTGFFLPEFTVPAKMLKNAGYELVFAAPADQKGKTKEPVMDEVSDSAQWFESEEEYQEAKLLLEEFRKKGMKTPVALASLKEKDLKQFSGIFLPGGHAPMEDLYKDKELGRILRHFHKETKPTGLICHAPVALLAAQTEKDWIYKGYNMTVFSNAEEKQEEDAGHLDGYLKYYVADALRKAGAKVSVANPWTSNVVRDRELITGQNPMSDKAFSKKLLKALIEAEIKSSKLKEYKGKLSKNNLFEVMSADEITQDQYITLYVGKRKENFSQVEFIENLEDHVELVEKKLSPNGLQAYYVWTDGSIEVAYQVWDSEESVTKIAEVAPEVPADGNRFMDFVIFEEIDALPEKCEASLK